MTEAEASIIIDHYHQVINIKPDGTRYAEQVKAKASMINALCKYMTKSSVARVYKHNHATIIHHIRKHEGNMVSWPGYKENFEIASNITSKAHLTKSRASKVEGLEAQIEFLEKQKSMIENKINYAE